MQEERDEKFAAEQECSRVRKELKKIKEASFFHEDTDDPYNPKIVSDEERKAEENKYQDYLKDIC